MSIGEIADAAVKTLMCHAFKKHDDIQGVDLVFTMFEPELLNMFVSLKVSCDSKVKRVFTNITIADDCGCKLAILSHKCNDDRKGFIYTTYADVFTYVLSKNPRKTRVFSASNVAQCCVVEGHHRSFDEKNSPIWSKLPGYNFRTTQAGVVAVQLALAAPLGHHK